MPYADGYDNRHAVFDHKKGFVQKPVQIKGGISIKSINPEFIKKNNVQVGDVMPWSRFRIIE